MPQTLTKPVLLDETGQEIVEKLDDIKEAIGTSSEFIPVMIKVVTPPTKTIYKVGDHLDLSGMVVNLIGTNGVNIDVTQACTCVPANGATLTNANTSVAITYHYAAGNIDFSTSQTLTIRELDSIAVTTPPIKTAYQTGETLDLTGIVVTATYSDGYTANITADCIFSPANGTVLTSSDTSVGVNYTEGSVTKSTTVAIGVKELASIAVTHLPTKTSYHAGETLDLTGIVVTATYDDSSTIDVTNNCTFSPADGDTLSTSDTSVLISYTEGSTTKTTSQVITVNYLVSIAVTTPPNNVDYTLGDTLDLTGIIVTATYSDLSSETVTQNCIFSPDNGDTLVTGDTSISISYTEYGITKTTSQAINLKQLIYGIKRSINTSDTSWERTDDSENFTFSASVGSTAGHSDFDNVYPWSGIEAVTDSKYGTQSKYIKIPKFWFKRYIDANSVEHIQISARPATGFTLHPAFDKAGTTYDYILVGAYELSADAFYSRSGVTVKNSASRSGLRNALTSRGGYNQMWDIATYSAITMLILVEVADWDVRTKIGTANTSTLLSTGTTNSVPTGTGVPTGNNVGVVWRGIENLWGNVVQWVDGINCDNSNNKFYVCNDPSKYADSTKTNYTELSYLNISATPWNGYVSKLGYDSDNPAYMFPIELSGSFTTYTTLKYITNGSGWKGAAVGGTYNSSNVEGLGLRHTNMAADSNNFGTRDMILPS